VTSTSQGRIELRQTTSNQLGLPLLIGAALVAIVVSQFAHGDASPTVLGVCAGAAVLDVLLALYLMRNLRSDLVVTRDDITFTRRQGKRPPSRFVISRTDHSTLTFRASRNGPMGSKYTGYTLKLRDTATGDEVIVGAFGRKRVQQACESLGWSFA
jgi:hypothetical protein